MTDQEEIKLRKVLDTNPFLQELNKWESDISSFVEGRTRLQELNFVLSSDEDNFQRYQKRFAHRTKTGNTFLHPELLPQPFIGDPRAPIWCLLLNPGYSYPDQHDHLGICPCCNRRVFVEAAKPSCIFNTSADGLEMLKKRQALLLRQLKLEKGMPFYLLDGSFNTLPDTPRYRREGGYRWWRSVLFGSRRSNGFLFPDCGVMADAESVGRKLFAIECCPYHSENFDARALWEGSEYTKFLAKLISWAVETDRKFIVRSKQVANVLAKNNLSVNETNSLLFSSSRNVSLTKRNLKGQAMVLDAVCQALFND